MWVKIPTDKTYQIGLMAIPEKSISAGFYNAEVLYRGTDEHQGLFLYRLYESLYSPSYYVISDSIGTDILMTSNIDQWTPTGSKVFTRSSFGGRDGYTIYSNDSDYVVLARSLNIVTPHHVQAKFMQGGIMPNDDIHNRFRCKRDGTLLTVPNNSGAYKAFESRVSYNYFASVRLYVQMMVLDTEDESTIEDATKLAFDSFDYGVEFGISGSFSGWISDTIIGEFEPFGDSEDSVKTGYLTYSDPEGRIYFLDFEITGNDDLYSVLYLENQKTYTKQGRPNESQQTFSLEGESDLVLEFEGFSDRNDVVTAFQTGVYTR